MDKNSLCMQVMENICLLNLDWHAFNVTMASGYIRSKLSLNVVAYQVMLDAESNAEIGFI